MRFREPLYQAIHIDRTGTESLQDQLVAQFRGLIGSGALEAGMRLPSTRTLADLLNVSRSVTLATFLVLHADGLIESRHGSGTYVSRRLPSRPERPVAGQRPEGDRRVSLAPDQHSIERFPRAAWRSAWRQACHQPPEVARDPIGEHFLRHAIATFLRSSRGIACDPRQVVVVGSRHGAFETLSQVLRGEAGAVAVEDPGHPLIRAVLGAGQAELAPAAVDGEGIDPRTVARGHARHVVVTPSHQSILGVRLSRGRRDAVLAWARDRDGIVVEHDRGSEYGYRAAPLPALLSMARTTDRVVYHGSLGEFAPMLQLEYLVLSELALERWPAGLQNPGGPVPWIVQRAAERLLADGHVSRQARRMRPVYERKRDAVQRALGTLGAGFWLHGASSGEAATLLTPPSVDAAAVAAALSAQGIDVQTVHTYAAAGGAAPNGLLIGFRHLPDVVLHRALGCLVRALDDHLPAATRSAVERAG